MSLEEDDVYNHNPASLRILGFSTILSKSLISFNVLFFQLKTEKKFKDYVNELATIKLDDVSGHTFVACLYLKLTRRLQRMLTWGIFFIWSLLVWV